MPYFLDYSKYIFELEQKHGRLENIPREKRESFGYEIFKNYPLSDHIRIQDFKHVAGKVYYDEAINLMEWVV